MLDSSNPSVQADEDYDYDDLYKIPNEDDDDLIGQVRDEEMDLPPNIADGELEDADNSFEDNGGDDAALEEAGGSDEYHFHPRRRKGK